MIHHVPKLQKHWNFFLSMKKIHREETKETVGVEWSPSLMMTTETIEFLLKRMIKTLFPHFKSNQSSLISDYLVNYINCIPFRYH